MAKQKPAEPLYPLAIFRPNARLALSAAIGAVIAWYAWDSLPFPFHLALGWIVGVLFFLVTTAMVVATATPERMRARARRQDASRSVILGVVVAAAVVSLFALGFMLQQKAGGPMGTGLRILIAGCAVLASWTLTHTMFALHYAHLFYGDDPVRKGEQDRRGLKFPDEENPDFWDFLYYAFVVGMTCQVSDVQVTGRHMRRLTLGHGVLAFFFNAIILALAVNFIAGAV
ncbi:MAG TPA: DUF1345 domain-containing protein [Stellaceae bacterium]|nr:DUF1345 domain-containing protein [Stellaceae bacterium]